MSPAVCCCLPDRIVRACPRHGAGADLAVRRRWYQRKRQTDPAWHDQYKALQRAYQRGYRRGREAVWSRGASLVCCGRWQAVTTLPHVCAQCGRAWLQQEPKP